MGMYTHCRGWMELSYDSLINEKFIEIMEEAENLSPRAGFCVCSTTFNVGSNGVPYIFIGGEWLCLISLNNSTLIKQKKLLKQ